MRRIGGMFLVGAAIFMSMHGVPHSGWVLFFGILAIL